MCGLLSQLIQHQPNPTQPLMAVFTVEQMGGGQDQKWQKDAADQNFDYMFKILIIGNSSVGKTSFLFRYADDSFTSAFVSTVGIDFKVKTVFRQDKRVKLQIWVCLVFINFEDSLISVGHGWTGEVQNDHNGLLQGCHGLHPHVWRDQWGVVQQRSGLVCVSCLWFAALLDFLLLTTCNDWTLVWVSGWRKSRPTRGTTHR